MSFLWRALLVWLSMVALLGTAASIVWLWVFVLHWSALGLWIASMVLFSLAVAGSLADD